MVFEDEEPIVGVIAIAAGDGVVDIIGLVVEEPLLAIIVAPAMVAVAALVIAGGVEVAGVAFSPISMPGAPYQPTNSGARSVTPLLNSSNPPRVFS